MEAYRDVVPTSGKVLTSIRSRKRPTMIWGDHDTHYDSRYRNAMEFWWIVIGTSTIYSNFKVIGEIKWKREREWGPESTNGNLEQEGESRNENLKAGKLLIHSYIHKTRIFTQKLIRNKSTVYEAETHVEHTLVRAITVLRKHLSVIVHAHWCDT